MAVNLKPTLVIVGGAFHTPQSYAKLTTALEKSGYEVHVPPLPSCNGARPSNADLYSDTVLIRGYVESLIRAGRNVVVIAHSYGGQVSTNALYDLGVEARTAKGLRGGVSGLIYLAAYALLEGTSTSDSFKQFGDDSNAHLVFDMADDMTMVNKIPEVVFGLDRPEVDKAEVEPYVKTLCRWSTKCIVQGLEHVAWREIPVAYIQAKYDLSITLPEQHSMIENMQKAGVKVQTFMLECGHCPHLVATQAVVDAVNTVIAGI